MSRYLFLVFLLALVACVGPSFKKVRGPDGKPAILISCQRYPQCYEDAVKICNGKYEIIPTMGKPQAGNIAEAPDGAEILVKCRK